MWFWENGEECWWVMTEELPMATTLKGNSDERGRRSSRTTWRSNGEAWSIENNLIGKPLFLNWNFCETFDNLIGKSSFLIEIFVKYWFDLNVCIIWWICLIWLDDFVLTVKYCNERGVLTFNEKGGFSFYWRKRFP